jgi:hypothetical protein
MLQYLLSIGREHANQNAEDHCLLHFVQGLQQRKLQGNSIRIYRTQFNQPMHASDADPTRELRSI